MTQPSSPPRSGKRLRLRRYVAAGAGLAAAGIFLTPVVAGAQETDTAEALATFTKQVNLLWVVLGAVLVIFMQAGFALVETGFCRAKNASHVITSNFAIFGLGFMGYFLIGYPLMFGGFTYSAFGYDTAVGGPLIGSGEWTFLYHGGWALTGIDKGSFAAVAGFFLYMVAFMDTVATIPTGSMAERWKWKAFVGWGLFAGTIYYPLFGAWTWGGGWLSQLGNSMGLGVGYVDFAGSGVVHAVGGVAALAGALVLGPRLGKYNKDGSSNAIPGHHLPMAFAGCFILLFGWFGFNAASTFAATDVQFAVVATNTALAAAFGASSCMFYLMYTGAKKPDPGMVVNGMLAGLVAITAPCAFVAPWAAAVIGAISGITVIWAVEFIDHKLKVDDPVGAVAVHGVHGLLGVLFVGIFSDGSYGAGWNLTTKGPGAKASGVTGILYDASLGGRQLLAQAIGAVVIATVIFGFAFAFFKIQNALMKGGIRASAEDELEGMDLPEMGALAYPAFGKAPGAEMPHTHLEHGGPAVNLKREESSV